MKKLLALLLLATPCFANGPKYVGSSAEPSLYQEILNLYHDIANPVINVGTASTMTVTQLNVSTIAVTGQIDMRSKKIINLANGTASTDAISLGQLHVRSTPQVSFSASETATNSATYVAAGPLITITPIDASSKFIVCTAGGFGNDNEAATNGYLTVKRGSTDLAQNAGGFYSTGSGTGTGSLYCNVALCLLDSPATASSVTYQVYIKHVAGAGNTRYPAFNAGAGNETATIFVLEVL